MILGDAWIECIDGRSLSDG